MKLIVLGDLHYPMLEAEDLEACQIRTQLYTEFFKILAEEKPDAYLCCGDLTNSGTLDDLQALLGLARSLPAPLYSVLGNHDTHGCSKAEFCTTAGNPPYYSVHIGDTKLIFLDTTMESCVEDWVGVMDEAQQLWLEREVRNSEGLSVILVAHHPVENTTRRSDEHRLRLNVDLWPILSQKCCGLYLNGHNHYHSMASHSGWLFVQTGDFLSHLDYRIVETHGDRITISTHPRLDELGGTHCIAPKMKRYTLYTNLHYDQCELSWEGDASTPHIKEGEINGESNCTA